MTDKSCGPYIPLSGLDYTPRRVPPVTIQIRLPEGAPRDIQLMVAIQDLLDHFGDVSRRRKLLVLDYLAEREESQ